jgi:hypothetical protein
MEELISSHEKLEASLAECASEEKCCAAEIIKIVPKTSS